jgi:predicted nuclease of restriction endonuclease-like (RecB) superfamily
MNYYSEIKNKLIENENYGRIKDYSKERYKVQTYYEVGKILSEAGKEYGENIIGQYAEKLQIELGKKYSERTLRRMRQLYQTFSNEKWSPMVTKLSWSHYIVLMTLKDTDKIGYYLEKAKKFNLSKRELEERIKNKEYERLDDSTKQKLINKEELTIQEIIKNPIIIHNKNNRIVITEKDLQNIILENISYFLKELGNKFCFIDNEYKIKIGDSYNYIDLLLYNSEYHCYVVVELKITELKKEYIGQIETYMNYVDKNVKDIIDNQTIGIIICKRDNHFIMEYCSDSRILSRYYKII